MGPLTGAPNLVEGREMWLPHGIALDTAAGRAEFQRMEAPRAEEIDEETCGPYARFGARAARNFGESSESRESLAHTTPGFCIKQAQKAERSREKLARVGHSIEVGI